MGSNEHPISYLFNSLLYIFLVFFASLMELYTLKLHNLNTHYTADVHHILVDEGTAQVNYYAKKLI